MKIGDLFSLTRDFLSQTDILDFLAESRPQDEPILSAARFLLIFDTRKQRTWLVADGSRLYCVIDRLREGAPILKWTLDRSRIVSAGTLTVNIQVFEVNKDIGRIKIGGKLPRLYSKRLFADRPIDQQVREFLSQSFLS